VEIRNTIYYYALDRSEIYDMIISTMCEKHKEHVVKDCKNLDVGMQSIHRCENGICTVNYCLYIPFWKRVEDKTHPLSLYDNIYHRVSKLGPL
jgi:hypothetical protein